MRANPVISMAVCVFFTLCIVCTPIHAQDTPKAGEAQENAEKKAELENPVTPVLKGKEAPFTGLLVPEGKFTKLMESKLENDDLKGQLNIQKNLTKNLEGVYLKRLEEATKPPKWYQTGEFKFWLGFILGGAAVGLAVYGAVEVVKATK